MKIRNATADDATAIAAIYNHFVDTTVITFEESRVDDEEMRQRIANLQAMDLPWLVAEHGGIVVGYAYAAQWRTRHAYRFSVESSVYVAPDYAGKGIGSALYCDVFARLRQSGYHLVIGGITLPNTASVALHEKLGFEKVAHFKEVGFKFERWLDVGYWQLKLAP